MCSWQNETLASKAFCRHNITGHTTSTTVHTFQNYAKDILGLQLCHDFKG
jgi:hypothetical protein